MHFHCVLECIQISSAEKSVSEPVEEEEEEEEEGGRRDPGCWLTPDAGPPLPFLLQALRMDQLLDEALHDTCVLYKKTKQKEKRN